MEKRRNYRYLTRVSFYSSSVRALYIYEADFPSTSSFRRYVLIEPPPRGSPATDPGEANPEGTLPAAPMPSTHGTSNNPSAERDASHGATHYFASAEDGIPGEGVGMNPASSSPGSASPRASAGAFRDNHSPRGGDRRLPRGSNNRRDSYSSKGGNWIDGRSKPNQVGVLGSMRGGASGSGSLWMEAAAAAAAATATREQPSAPSGTWEAGVGSKRLGSGASGSENEASSAAVATDGFVGGVGKSKPLSSPEGGSFRQTLASQRSWKQPPNTSLTVDDVSSPHLAVEASAVRETYSRAAAEPYGGRTSNQPSAMARAAEEVAAATTAKGHPLARRVEEHMHAVQSGVDRALATLEVWLKPLVKRRQSPASSAGGQGSIRGSPSAYRSPHDPRPPLAWSETGERGTRWIASASTTAEAAAPLASAAALLMERANARRLEMIDSAHALRERAISLAVAEASTVGGGGDSPDPGAPFSRNFLGGGGSLFSPSSDERYVGGAAHRLKATAVGVGGASGQTTVQEVAEGLPGLSSCRDFERILGEETRGRDCTASLVMSVDSDLESSVSDSSVVAEPSSTSFGADVFAVGGGRFASTARGVSRGKYSPTRKEIDAKSSPDSWREVFRDVAVVEERWKGLAADWCSAGLAFREACEDDFGEADGGKTQDFLSE